MQRAARCSILILFTIITNYYCTRTRTRTIIQIKQTLERGAAAQWQWTVTVSGARTSSGPPARLSVTIYIRLPTVPKPKPEFENTYETYTAVRLSPSISGRRRRAALEHSRHSLSWANNPKP